MPPTIPQRSHAQLNPQRTDPSQMRISLILLNLKLRIYDIGEIPKPHGDLLVCVGLGVEYGGLVRQVGGVRLGEGFGLLLDRFCFFGFAAFSDTL